MIPVTESDDSSLVIDIVEVGIWIVRIVNDKRPAKTVAVLSCDVRMVPVCARLVRRVETIRKRVVGNDRALIDPGRAIHVICCCLEQSMPMDRGRTILRRIREQVDYVDLE